VEELGGQNSSFNELNIMGEEEAVLSCLLATTTHTGKEHSRGEWMEE
jgi:hypothetical protein